MQICNRNLTSLQRRSLSLIAASLAVCASLSLSLHEVPLHHFLPVTYAVIALIGASPVILTLVVLARYLAAESDEYLRSLVIRSMLWGFGLTMIADTMLGYLIAFASVEAIHLRTLGVFNLEMFIVAAAIALRVQLWRDR